MIRIRTAIALALSAAVLGGFAWFGLYDDSGTIRAANRVAVPASWSLDSELVARGRLLCSGGTDCPWVQRNYDTPAEMSNASFQALLERSGLPFTPSSCTSGVVHSCRAVAIEDGVRVSVKWWGASEGSKTGRLALSATLQQNEADSTKE